MHVMQRPVRQRVRKRMYLPSERQVVNGVGLGELEGMFNIGKMFTRMFTFTPSSFKIKNILGAVGSLVTTTATMGMANVLSEVAGPSGLKLTKGTVTGAHSTAMKVVGGVSLAAGAVLGGAALLPAVGGAGAGAAAGTEGMMAAGTGVLAPAAEAAAGSSFFALPTFSSAGTLMTAGSGVLAPVAEGGILSTIGGALSTVGSGLMTVMKALPIIGQVMGGGGGGQQQQQQDGSQAQYDAQVAAYNAQIAAQQAAMYTPGGYQPNIPFVADQYAGITPTTQPSMQTSYGDLRTPYTAITEDGQQVQVDPSTGQVIEQGMSVPMMIGVGGVVLLAGWYLMSDSKSTVTN
jgi:hypothetical protein